MTVANTSVSQGTVVGPQTCAALKANMGADQVACQGIGTEDGYAAGLAPNFQPKNTDAQSIQAAVDMVNLAVTQCPDTTIVMGGYSQGSAVVDNALQEMPPAQQAKVAGVVVWGFTRAAQDNRQIPGYPADQTKVFCAPGDLVCNNTLTITAAHLTYGANAAESGAFLAKMAKAAGTGKAATGAAAGGDAGAEAGGAADAATGASTGAAAGGEKENAGGLFGGLFGN